MKAKTLINVLGLLDPEEEVFLRYIEHGGYRMTIKNAFVDDKGVQIILNTNLKTEEES
jgi:hypothetical protein